MVIKPDNAAEISVITIYIGSNENEEALAAYLELDVVAHATHLSTRKAGKEDREFKAILGYRMSLRLPWIT